MTGCKGHLIVGGLFAAGLIAVFTWLDFYTPGLKQGTLLAAITLMAALLPDADKEGEAKNYYYGLMLVTYGALMIQHRFRETSVLAFYAVLPAFSRVGNWTHQWWAVLAAPLPIIFLPMIFYGASLKALLPFYLAAAVGYLSHLLVDRVF